MKNHWCISSNQSTQLKFMQDPKRRKPWYHRVREMATIWRTVSTKHPPIPAATTTTTLWRTIVATAADNPPHHRHHQDHSKLQKCTSLRVASSFTRACLCVPLSSYNEVFRSEINCRPPHPTPPPPRRSNSYPRSRSVNSSLSPSVGGSAQPRRSVEVTAATVVVMRRREVFRGKSLREDVVMRRFVAEEETAMVQARRRNQMEAVRRRSLARRKKVGPSRLSRMVMAGD